MIWKTIGNLGRHLCGVFFVKSLLSAVWNGWGKIGSAGQCWAERTSLEKSVVQEGRRRDKLQSFFKLFRAGFSEQ